MRIKGNLPDFGPAGVSEKLAEVAPFRVEPVSDLLPSFVSRKLVPACEPVFRLVWRGRSTAHRTLGDEPVIEE